MNVQQEGLGLCTRCGSPIMQAIGQPGIKGVCLGCRASAEPKTGRTVVVTSETGEGTELGRVTLQEVEHQPGAVSPLPKDPEAIRKSIMDKANAKGIGGFEQLAVTVDVEGTINIKLTVDELMENGIVLVLLQSLYDAIDSMPPGKTIKETKRMIKLQEDVELLLKQKEK